MFNFFENNKTKKDKKKDLFDIFSQFHIFNYSEDVLNKKIGEFEKI